MFDRGEFFLLLYSAYTLVHLEPISSIKLAIGSSPPTHSGSPVQRGKIRGRWGVGGGDMALSGYIARPIWGENSRGFSE